MLFSRILGFFILFLASASNLFAEGNFLTRPFTDLFGKDGLFYILNTPEIMVVLIFLAIFLAFVAVMKLVLHPVFKGHEKERNTVATALALIGSIGIFFVFGRDGSGNHTPETLIVLFGGSIGFFFLLIACVGFVSFFLPFCRAENEDGKLHITKKGWAILLFILSFCFYILSIYIEAALLQNGLQSSFWSSLGDNLMGAMGYAFLAGVIALFLAFKQKKGVEQFVNEDPKVVQSKSVIDDIQKSLKSVNDKMKKISKEMEDF